MTYRGMTICFGGGVEGVGNPFVPVNFEAEPKERMYGKYLTVDGGIMVYGQLTVDGGIMEYGLGKFDAKIHFPTLTAAKKAIDDYLNKKPLGTEYRGVVIRWSGGVEGYGLPYSANLQGSQSFADLDQIKAAIDRDLDGDGDVGDAPVVVTRIELGGKKYRLELHLED